MAGWKKCRGDRINCNSSSFCFIFVTSSTTLKQFHQLFFDSNWRAQEEIWVYFAQIMSDVSETLQVCSFAAMSSRNHNHGNRKVSLLLQKLSNLELNCRKSPTTKPSGGLEELYDLYAYRFIWLSHTEDEPMPTKTAAKHFQPRKQQIVL